MNDSDLHGLNEYMNWYDDDFDDKDMTYDYRAARGIFAPADEPAEVSVRRLRDGDTLAAHYAVMQGASELVAVASALGFDDDDEPEVFTLVEAAEALTAENQLYRKLLGDVLASNNGCWIPYAEIEYALEGERPGEDIVKALADVKAERDRLREQVETLQAQAEVARAAGADTGAVDC